MNSNKTKKKNIAIVHYSYPPVVGGVEFIMETHAKQFAKAGHQVKIITGAGRSLDPNILIHALKTFPQIQKRQRLFRKNSEKDFLHHVLEN